MSGTDSPSEAHAWELPFVRVRASRGWVLGEGPRWVRQDGFVVWRGSAGGRWRVSAPAEGEVGPSTGFEVSGEAIDFVDWRWPRGSPGPGGAPGAR